MGTRGCYGFRIDGKDKLTYNHFDSYPSGLGLSILQYAHDRSMKNMTEVAKRIKLVCSKKPTKKQIQICKKYADLGVSTGKIDDWYCLLRDAQGNLEAHDTVPFMIDSSEFVYDSLFCEWAYIINLDTKVLEIYKGFNKNPNEKGRYAGQKEKVPAGQKEPEYYGVRLVYELPLKDLRAMKKVEVNAFAAKLHEKLEKEEALEA